MSKSEPRFEDALVVVRKLASEVNERSRRHQKRVRRLLLKIAKTVAWLFGSSVVIVTSMIASGRLFGPRGVEGLLLLPVLLFGTWASIIYFGWFFRRSSTRALPKADILLLPEKTEEWLEDQRHALPSSTRGTVEQILQRLEVLTVQVRGLDPQSPSAFEVKRLIGEELPELVSGYQKVPRALRGQALHGGTSPDRQLQDGLSTIDEQLEQLQTRLASEDMKALATQQRYLELKYKNDKRSDD